MRNGVKDYYNQDKLIYLIIGIICIILFGFFILFILRSKKLDIEIDVSTYKNFNNINFLAQDNIQAEFYEEQVETTSHPSFNGNCSDKFLNARAMVIGDSTAEGLTAYGILDSSSVIWTRGRTIQYMKEDIGPVLNYKPDVLFLSYGANDLLSWNGNVDGYINAYSNVLDYLSSTLPNTRICINSVLPVSNEAKEKNSAYNYQEEFNTRLKELCGSRGITFIDNSFILNNSPDGKVYESDGVHPRPFYYRQWANNMITASGI